uniref:Rho-related protein racB-like isoform X2 n=1 Tax=Crassostrea virginica TaxID=6565 RepID=A0A8B8BC60_CRAVI|nr:rho-related protein racB-like isoform X2 [Crassostrea virginica]
MEQISQDPAMQNVKLVLVGDGCVGKTELVSYFSSIPCGYKATVSDNYTGTLLMDDKTFCLDIRDTGGLEDYDRIRCLSYPQTDVLMLCYSIGCRNSFENIEFRWIPEIKHYCPNTPILLVACKTDLRSTSSHEDLITTNEGQALANKLRLSFCETSGLKKAGVKECFEAAVKCMVDNQMAAKKGGYERKMKKAGRKCSIV